MKARADALVETKNFDILENEVDRFLETLATHPAPDGYQLTIQFEYPYYAMPNREQIIHERYFVLAKKLAAVLLSDHCPNNFGFNIPIFGDDAAAQCLIDTLNDERFKRNLSMISFMYADPIYVKPLCEAISKKQYQHLTLDLTCTYLLTPDSVTGVINLLNHPHSPRDLRLNLDLFKDDKELAGKNAWKIMDNALLNNKTCTGLSIYCPTDDYCKMKEGITLANQRRMTIEPATLVAEEEAKQQSALTKFNLLSSHATIEKEEDPVFSIEYMSFPKNYSYE